MLRNTWKNEMEIHEEKTIQIILSRYFKKIRSGLSLVMNRVAALLRMINDTNEEDEEFIQEAHTYGSFLLSKRIQDKIGKKISKGNMFRRIPKNKSTIEEQIEGKDVEKDLKEAKYRADRLATIMEGLRSNCGYLQETFREELFDEFTRDQNQELKKMKSNTKKRIQSQLVGMGLAQIHNLEKYIEDGSGPRNENELYELLQSKSFEDNLEKWSEEVKKAARE
jgi:hypothetical protein